MSSTWAEVQSHVKQSPLLYLRCQNQPLSCKLRWRQEITLTLDPNVLDERSSWTFSVIYLGYRSLTFISSTKKEEKGLSAEHLGFKNRYNMKKLFLIQLVPDQDIAI